MNRLIVLVVCTSLFFSLTLAQQHEERLISHLFNLSEPSWREVLKLARPPGENGTKVDLSYSDLEVKHFDEESGDLTVTLLESGFWTDTRLMWNPEEYGGLPAIKLPSSYLWMPDMTLFTTSGEIHSKEEEKCIIFSNGGVAYIPKRTFTFPCDLDLAHFPYDTQTCEQQFGSWVHSTEELDIRLSEITDSLFAKRNHSDWILVSQELSSENKQYSCCPEAYQTLTLKLVLKRKPKFYFHLLVAPWKIIFCVLPLLHLLPPGCSQKGILAGLLFVCSILAHIELYQQIRGHAGDNAPDIVYHYRNQMILIVVSIAISSLTAALANTSHTSMRVPSIIRKVTNSLPARIFCVNLGGNSGNLGSLPQPSGDEVRYCSQTDMAPIVQDTDHERTQDSAVRHLVNELKLSRERRQLEIEWNQLALLVDRVAVIFFVIYAIAATHNVN